MTIRDVAAHLGVGWDLVKDIQKRDLSRRFAKPRLKHLRRIAIDEIAVATGAKQVGSPSALRALPTITSNHPSDRDRGWQAWT
jgi:hypothetical protein